MYMRGLKELLAFVADVSPRANYLIVNVVALYSSVELQENVGDENSLRVIQFSFVIVLNRITCNYLLVATVDESTRVRSSFRNRNHHMRDFMK
ncbi:hypothetical protein AVEN_221312-1 [Araneus ventricosus]|uniref:Uncharacterized protein n=1 Tax=Araneus ventricosus TaxID=182803 RepID=A0A4Y2AYB5_ARAVE|nr:hypothetical protein AVEN_221312-1 [Araneus ventricosus]